MQIFISPAKQMKPCDDFVANSQPWFQQEADQLIERLSSYSIDALKKLYACSDAISQKAYDMIHSYAQAPVYPALFYFSAIQYTYMAPDVFTNQEMEYIRTHLRIGSGLYGILRPMDGIKAYRLEMNQKPGINLYDFWKNKLAQTFDDPVILNLASAEYAKSISKYCPMIDVRFYEQVGDQRKEKGVHVKMARGRMVRYMAEHQVEQIEQLYDFDELGFHFDPQTSTKQTLIYVKGGS